MVRVGRSHPSNRQRARRSSRSGWRAPADVARAAESAEKAQREWAATPHPARAAVLRRAGQLWEQHAEEIMGWNVREVGAIPPLAGFALHVTAAECYEAAALPSAPLGSILSSEEPRLSFAQQVPVGVVAVISPFNVPLILGIRAVAPALALGNAVLLKPDPRTVVTGGVAMVRIFEEAGLPAGLLQLVPGGADVGEALVSRSTRPRDRLHGVDPRGTYRRRTRGQASEAGAPRTRRQLGVPRAARCRRRSSGQPRDLGRLPAPGADLHVGRPSHRARVALRRVR